MQYYMEFDTNTHDTCIAYMYIYICIYICIYIYILYRILVLSIFCLSSSEVNDFDVVIVDEVHERHLVVDFVLGILREAWGKLGGSSKLRLGRR